ncbi:unnamed protein product, partial [Prorocentrum cordatum]
AVFRLVSSRGLDPSQGCVYINTSYTLLRADNNGCRRCPAAGPAPPAARDRRRRPDPEPPRGPGRRGPSSSGGQAKPPTGDEPAGRRGTRTMSSRRAGGRTAGSTRQTLPTARGSFTLARRTSRRTSPGA